MHRGIKSTILLLNLAVDGFYIGGLSGHFILIFMCRILPEAQI